ncbi:HAMP domain-containing protein [Elioraea sp. Yellowstone]|jgi:methyl-accepting chemotaxis protein|uniref:methyl-accepting chemotaxis protein n=1 Tax=Elioraea sp. Yellowstone TaxID=2592070 RepID=UPI00115393FD|nr:methyl-accepting chemotaxis protein [Elioraea sp. Yellowstone]TQF77340.1 HAMP domain-containing protein [Elioraea sp. Yellowstone]
MTLASIRFTTKINVFALSLTVLLAVVAGTGLTSLATLSGRLHDVAGAGHSASEAGRMARSVLQIRRRENQIAAEPTAEVVAAARAAMAEQAAFFRNTLVEAKTIAGPARQAVLARLEQAFDRYHAAAGATLQAAETAAAGRGDRDAVLAALRAGVAAFDAVDGLSAELDRTAIGLAETAAAEAEAEASRSFAVMAGATGLGLVLALALAWAVGARGIAAPVRAAAARLKTLAEGDTDSPIPGVGRKDEAGEIAAAMAVFRDNLMRTREMQAEIARRDEEARQERRRAMLAAADRFEAEVGSVVKGVAASATELEATATGMAAGAEETSRQVTAVAAAAEQASANVQTVAAAAEELAASIAEISRQVAESTRIASEAVAEATRTNATVESLAASAQRIGEVVRLINDIAGQTNLLALNATIEAARAGEAGKGFAVVASEVKNLASQTAKATEEIGGQIAAVQGETGRVVEAIRAIGGTIEKISAIAASIAAAVEQQGAATQEIARNVQQAAAGTGSVTANIASVNEAAASSGAAAAQVQSAAGELSRGAETLRAQVERFLAEMKAA